MIIALALAAIILPTDDRPYQQSAQCLVEIARLSGERLDILEPWMIEAAQRKADALWENRVKLRDAQAQVDIDSAATLAHAQTEEAAGRLPAGSVDVLRQQIARDREVVLQIERRDTFDTPSCRWPAPIGPAQSSPAAAGAPGHGSASQGAR